MDMCCFSNTLLLIGAFVCHTAIVFDTIETYICLQCFDWSLATHTPDWCNCVSYLNCFRYHRYTHLFAVFWLVFGNSFSCFHFSCHLSVQQPCMSCFSAVKPGPVLRINSEDLEPPVIPNESSAFTSISIVPADDSNFYVP